MREVPMKGWVATYSNRPTQANLQTPCRTLELQRQTTEPAETVPPPPERLSAPSTAPAENPRS